MGRKIGMIVSGSGPDMTVLISDNSKSAGPMEYDPEGRGVVCCEN